MQRLIFLIITLGCITGIAWSQVGTLRGTVLDGDTQQPLIGVNVMLMGTQRGAATDTLGNYLIENVPVGAYTMRFSYMGYETKTIPDVIVKSSKINYVNTELSWDVLQGEQITVTTSYFEAADDAPVSLQLLNREEVRRSPGSREDVSRMLQNMAGVNPSSDDRNDLIVRGGSPTEVLYMIDDIEVPNPNHFGTQGATGGPVSMVNNEFIENVKFMAGGFPADYAHKVSAVIDIQFREGNRHEYNGKLDLSFAGAGGYVEGPLGKQRGSFLIGLHRSFLDILEGTLNYGGVPIYSNIQGKVVYDLNPNHQISLLWLGGDDRIDMDYELDSDDFKSGKLDTVDYNNTIFRSRQLTVGTSLRSLWQKNFYTKLILSHSINHFYVDINFLEIAAERMSGSDDLQGKTEITNIDLFDNTSNEYVSSVKFLGNWFPEKSKTLTFGTYLNLYRFDHNMKFIPAKPNEPDSYGQKSTGAEVNLNQSLTPKVGAFVNYKQRFWHRFVYNLGARYDYFKLLDTGSFSPRFSLFYDVTERLTLQTGVGRYFQSPELINISADPSNEENLRDFSCDHYIAGLSYLLTPSTRLTLEVYHKKYDHYPVMADSGYEMLSLANSGADYGGNYLNRLTSEGEGKADGVEVMLQKKLAENIYGLVSYSYSEIRHQALDGILRNGSFDNRQVFNMVAGYRLNKSWEFSVKWRYAGGAPYTPYDRAASIATGDGKLDLTRVNAERFDPYHRLDFRFDHRVFFEKGTLVSYMSIENVYDRQNIYSHFWSNAQQTTKFTYQTGLFIVGGVSFEF